MDELLNDFGYVQFLFQDGTSQIIYTTLSASLLERRGAVLRAGYLYDVQHGEYVKIREDAVQVYISKDIPKVKGGLDEFAHRFI